MKRFLSDLILLSGALVFFVSVGFYIRYHKTSVSAKEVYTDSSGKEKYASGICSTNMDCAPRGCSTQVCSSEKNLVTTCELREDFPHKIEFSCGCINSKCAWYKSL